MIEKKQNTNHPKEKLKLYSQEIELLAKMDFGSSTIRKPRIAWGGDHYFMNDGKSTEYYINLQRMKVEKEKKRTFHNC